MAQIKLNATYGMTGTLPAVSGANLTTLNGTQVTSGTVADARISALTSSKLTGALPALNASALTNLDARDLENALPAISGASLTGVDAGKLLQVSKVTPDPGINSLGVVAWTEIHSTFRCAITPTSASSNLILSAQLIYGNNNTSNLGHFKFYDITNSANVNLPSNQGNRTQVHGSCRHKFTDTNDTDCIFLQTITPSSNTTARTYSVYFTNEIGGGTYTTKYFFGQNTNVSQLGCQRPTFIIMEYGS